MFRTNKKIVVAANGGKKRLTTTVANYGFGYPGGGIQSLLGPTSGNMSISGIGAGMLLHLDTLMSGIIPEDERSLRRLYRDIYAYDVVAGSAVDLMSTLPFSDFTLSGASSKKLDVFMRNVEQLNIKTLFPDISTEFLSLGAFTGTLCYSRKDKEFTDIIPHNPDYLTIEPTPMYGADPKLILKVSEQMRKFLHSTDPYMQEMRQRMPASMVKAMRNSAHVSLDPLTTLHIPRRTTTRDLGTSIYKRILPIYLLEKVLYRGTVTELTKRQRSTTHLKMGSEYFEPQDADLQALTALFQQAENDPLGAIIATRMDVDVSDVRPAGDFVKWTDFLDVLQPLKFKALGISDAFLSGDANWNTADAALSVFLEQLRAYRQMLTQRVLYDKVFPAVAVFNDFKGSGKQRNNRNSERAFWHTANPYDEDEDTQEEKGDFLERMRDKDSLIIPEVHWQKQLRPEADREYLDVLNTMSEKGVPVTLRAWAAAGGVDFDRMMEGLNEDLQTREKLRELAEKYGPPTNEEGEFDQGGFSPEDESEHEPLSDEGGIESYAAVQKVIGSFNMNRGNFLMRDFGDGAMVKGKSKTGKPTHIINQSQAMRKQNEVIAGSLKRLADANYYDKVVKDNRRKKGGKK